MHISSPLNEGKCPGRWNRAGQWGRKTMANIFNRTSEKGKRKQLRKTMPEAEVILWSRLKNKQLAETKFRRQYSVGKYVVDFYCAEKKLAIELDGESHFVEGAQEKR